MEEGRVQNRMDYRNAFAISREKSEGTSLHSHVNNPTASRSDWNVLLKYLAQSISKLAYSCHYAAAV